MVTFPGLILLAALPLYQQLWTINWGGGAQTQEADKTITFLTANVHNYRNRGFELIEQGENTRFIVRIDPTIMTLQESHRFRGKRAGEVGRESGLEMRHQPNRVAVATYASELVEVEEYFPPGKFYNGFLVSDVTTELGTIRVINAHLESNQISNYADDIGGSNDLRKEASRAKSMFKNYGVAAAKRADQADAIRKAVNGSPHPVILAGDFNDVPASYTYRRTLTPRLRDAWVEAGSGLGSTFVGPLPGLRIDFIMVDTAFTVHSIERVDTGFSDHLGLKAVLSK